MASLIRGYDPAWPAGFAKIRDILCAGLDDPAYSVEHVGSTSVPGLAAKPIIDIDIVYPDAAVFAALSDKLSTLGYTHNGDQGIPGREAFKRVEDGSDAVLDVIRHHLYACPSDSLELRRHLLFRDYLRTHEEIRIEYEGLKFRIAVEAGQDHESYARLKESRARKFIEQIILKAEECGIDVFLKAGI